jgi:alcohol dehydrogenase (cytochrome c)
MIENLPDGRTRLGDNLYTDSAVALDADTGKLKWHYQFTPHDEMDWERPTSRC